MQKIWQKNGERKNMFIYQAMKDSKLGTVKPEINDEVRI